MSSRIRMQADDFFNAYQVLSEHSDSVSLTTMGPTIVNLALAVELYIKDLHFVLKGKAPRGHNILKLFRDLDEGIQEEIRYHASIQKILAFHSTQMFPLYIPKDKNKHPITDIFEQQIHKISDAFVKWRYSHESGTLRYDESFALAFIEAVKSAAGNARRRQAA